MKNGIKFHKNNHRNTDFLFLRVKLLNIANQILPGRRCYTYTNSLNSRECV